MSKAIQCIESIIKTYNTAEESLQLLTRELSKSDLATQDILHFIEFDELDHIIELKTAKQLKDIRKFRREAKNEIELLQKLLSRLDRNQLYQLLSDIKKAEIIQANRMYNPRVLHNFGKASNQ